MANKKRSALFNVNTLLSVWDPEFRKWAQEKWSRIPDGHFLKSVPFERGFGVFKGWAEKKSGSLPWPLGDVVEKLTDVGDFAIRGTKGARDTAHDWMDRFYAEAAKRLEKATDPELEFEKIKLEFELRAALLKVIEEARKAAEPAKPEKVSIDWSKIRDQYETFLLTSARFSAKAVNQAEKTARDIDHWAGNTAAPRVRQFRQFLETRGIRREKPKGRFRLWLERRRAAR